MSRMHVLPARLPWWIAGHGISGCSAGSPESFAATATFFTVAIVVTFAVHLITGGAV